MFTLFQDPALLIQLAIIIVISITVHEFAHAWTSDRLGDPTPKMMGRLTLNPLAHLDPLWFILIFVIGFGRGKPVQINPSYFRHPIRDELWVALAWPASNIVLAILSIIIVLVSVKTGSYPWEWFISFWQMFGILNCALAVFNMIPLPALDGFRLVKIFAPIWAAKLQMISWRYSIATFILLYIGSRFLWPWISEISLWLYQWLQSLFVLLFMI